MDVEAEDSRPFLLPGGGERSRLRTPSCEPLGSEGMAANLESMVRNFFENFKIFFKYFLPAPLRAVSV